MSAATDRGDPRTERAFLITGDEGTERWWRQCRICWAYAEGPLGTSQSVTHLAWCPVAQVAALTASVEALTQERDQARADVVRMATTKVGEKCEHHKQPLAVLESLALAECPICWKSCAEHLEAAQTTLLGAIEAVATEQDALKRQFDGIWNGDLLTDVKQLRAEREALITAVGQIAREMKATVDDSRRQGGLAVMKALVNETVLEWAARLATLGEKQ